MWLVKSCSPFPGRVPAPSTHDLYSSFFIWGAVWASDMFFLKSRSILMDLESVQWSDSVVPSRQEGLHGVARLLSPGGLSGVTHGLGAQKTGFSSHFYFWHELSCKSIWPRLGTHTGSVHVGHHSSARLHLVRGRQSSRAPLFLSHLWLRGSQLYPSSLPALIHFPSRIPGQRRDPGWFCIASLATGNVYMRGQMTLEAFSVQLESLGWLLTLSEFNKEVLMSREASFF